MDSRDGLEERKPSRGILRHVDSLHMEAGRIPRKHVYGDKELWSRTLRLAFQSIGVVYGDIGTSPLYVYSSTFPNGIDDTRDLLGVLSLIIYTILLIPFLKYLFVVLFANDNGDGGTFALYSLISRNVRVSLIPNQQDEDTKVSNFKLDTPTNPTKRALWLKDKMEKSLKAKIALFLVTILATSMIIGDGVLTPCISVIGALQGIQERAPNFNQDKIAYLSAAVLVLLFLIQRFGTDKVGYTFAPLVLIWFLFIGGIGVYNLIKHDIKVLRAFNPKYIVDYFKRNKKQGWISLGGVVLAITGTEAMFADLGHFNVRAIQIGFSFALLPGVILSYIGQAAYLTKFPENVGDTFYKSIPHSLFWPQLIIAICAAIIASQAMISGAFAIISQSQALGCFPNVKVKHTSPKYEGQVYVPEINYALMIICVAVTIGFKTTGKIGNAYGIAVVMVMTITTFMVTLVMLLIWRTRLIWILMFLVIFGGIELIYLSSVLYKFKEGGYLPFAFGALLMIIMGVWHYVHVKKYYYELDHKVSGDHIKELITSNDAKRIPGIGLLYSNLVQGIPPIFEHYIRKIPCIHSIFIFTTIKHLPIPRVELDDRFLFRQLKPREMRMFRCVARYGYNDSLEDHKEFEAMLIEALKMFVHEELILQGGVTAMPSDRTKRSIIESDFYLPETNEPAAASTRIDDANHGSKTSRVHVEESTLNDTPSAHVSSRSIEPAGIMPSGMLVPAVRSREIEEEKQFIHREMERGVVYLLAESEIVAHPSSNILKVAVINYLYRFLKRNFRQGENMLDIPRDSLLKVGMTYEI